MTGDDWSTDFPTTSGAYDTTFNGHEDVFVSKLNSGLTSLLASTYLAGAFSADLGNSLPRHKWECICDGVYCVNRLSDGERGVMIPLLMVFILMSLMSLSRSWTVTFLAR